MEKSKKPHTRIEKSLPSEGILYNEADFGPSRAGQITRLVNPQKNLSNGINHYFLMTVNGNLSKTDNFVTIAHELGHMFCGHLGSPVPGWLPERRGLSLNEREFEAESVAWLVCHRQGIRPNSDEYLSGYLNEHEEIPNISLDAVLRSVTIIEDMAKGTHKPSAKLKVKENSSSLLL